MSPQRQREFFALALIGVGALLLLFLFSSNGSGGGKVGQWVTTGLHSAFGMGAVLVPALFVVVGSLILVQEHFSDLPITGGNVAGILMLAVLVLALLETKNINELAVRDAVDGSGGGLVGLTVNRMLVGALGQAATWMVLLLLLVVAVLLTFNMTLRQGLGGIRNGARALNDRLIGPPAAKQSDELAPEPVPFSHELKRGAVRPPAGATGGQLGQLRPP
ncbi:MAG: hypothetical protein NVSMB42_05170 [Herpetosiphon sp.]